ncbi:hypothetical protein K3495_g1350 [Podosphaera aphanis]|nr:hypothetical protein K3495_g1350 [Podosphaera aphanis]
MPLHLLGKKSWNVYNRANIENVRRDEAIAKAAEEAEEERMQALDAERRMQILRGEELTPLPAPAEFLDSKKRDGEKLISGRAKKPRKKYGEDDAEYEIRIARQQFEQAANVSKQCTLRPGSPLRDSHGFFSIFPEDGLKKKKSEKNPEAESEAARKKRDFEDQYTMRFSNAAGLRRDPGKNPWYSKDEWIAGMETVETSGTDVWGNEDPRRKEREQKRVVSNDPLAMMKAGARKAREVEKERKKWREDMDLERQFEDHSQKNRRRSRHGDYADTKLHRHDREKDQTKYKKRGDPREENRRHKHRQRDSHHESSLE